MAMMVEVEARRGDSAKADAALRALTAKHPKRVETALTNANLAMSRGQYAAAIAAFRAALTRDESTANALALVGAHLAAGEAAKAASFLQGWVKTRPNDLPAQKALAESQFRAGQLAAARQSYATVLASQSDDAAMLNNYANLLQQLKDPGAQDAAEKALKLAPENSSYADTLGWILVQKGQADAGLRYLREARLRNPENGEIRFHLAYALSKTGRKAEAKEELSAALGGSGRAPTGEGVSQLKKELGL
jgi:predicted Zn-dependent protease